MITHVMLVCLVQVKSAALSTSYTVITAYVTTHCNDTFVANNHVVLIGTSSTTGTVNIVQGTQWYSVCDHSWTLEDARVLCRSMGYW